MRRRAVLAGLVTMAAPAPSAHAEGSRVALPGGGSVPIPRRYALEHPPAPGAIAVILYRNLTTNMGGVRVCDGLIVVAAPGQFSDWENFALAGRSAATSGWQSSGFMGDQKPNWQGEGRERWRPLSVGIVGFWRVYDAPAVQAVFEDPRGVRAQVWIFERHGGLRAARTIAKELFAGYRP